MKRRNKLTRLFVGLDKEQKLRVMSTVCQEIAKMKEHEARVYMKEADKIAKEKKHPSTKTLS